MVSIEWQLYSIVTIHYLKRNKIISVDPQQYELTNLRTKMSDFTAIFSKKGLSRVLNEHSEISKHNSPNVECLIQSAKVLDVP